MSDELTVVERKLDVESMADGQDTAFIPHLLSPMTHHSSLIAHHLSAILPWRLPTLAVLQVVLFAGIFVLNFFEETDPDFWWHLATGRYIVETGTIPHADIFSYTAAGQPWVAHEWLAEIVMFLLYRSGGYLAAVLVFAALITIAYWIMFRTLRLLGVGVIGSTLITSWMAAMSVASWNVRPQAFSYVFFALYLYVLLLSRRRSSRMLWLMPAIMAAWVNLHAGYIMGLLLIALFVVGEAVNRVTERRGDRVTRGRGDSSLITHHSSLRSYVLVGLATVAATVVNPQGISMLMYPFQYAGTQNASMKFVAEWQSPNFHNYFFFVFAAAILLLMVTSSRRPQDWAIAVPLLALTAMTLQSVRVIAFFAIAAAPYVATRVSALGAHHPSLVTHDSPLPQRRGSPLNWAFLAVCLVAMALPLFVSDRAQVGPEPRTTSYPVEGVRYLQLAGLPGNLFNTYHWGGYLAWEFYPERRVFVDGRADLYGDPFVEKYITAYEAGSGWRQVLDEYGIEVALIEKDSRIATLLAATGEWREAFRGSVESVFVRSAEGRQ
jgi:hypothetical protein